MKTAVLRKFPREFVKAVKEEYPKRTTLHDALDREETSVEWHLRQGAQFSMSAQQVVDAFKKWRPDKIYKAAKTCLRREVLLTDYLRIMARYQPSVIHHARHSSKKTAS